MMFLRLLKAFLVILFIPLSSEAQGWKPQFEIGLNTYYSIRIKDPDLDKFLSFNHPSPLVRDCETQLSIFYFRVNSKGKVDSIYVKGTSHPDIVNPITRAIYETDNYWQVPPHTKPEDYCWFVYPYFYFGRQTSCSEEQAKSFRQTDLLFQLLRSQKTNTDLQGRYVLPPNNFIHTSMK